GNADMQAGGEPDDRQIHQSPDHVIAFLTWTLAVRTGVVHSNRGGVDDGDASGVGGTGDRQSDLGGPADGIGHEVATRMHSRVLVRADGSIATLILYRPGPLYVVPPRNPPRGQLRTPKREEPV